MPVALVFQLIDESVHLDLVEDARLCKMMKNFVYYDSVGDNKAISFMDQIAKGEDPEIVMNSLASLLEQNFNAEESFLNSENEEDIE